MQNSCNVSAYNTLQFIQIDNDYDGFSTITIKAYDKCRIAFTTDEHTHTPRVNVNLRTRVWTSCACTQCYIKLPHFS